MKATFCPFTSNAAISFAFFKSSITKLFSLAIMSGAFIFKLSVAVVIIGSAPIVLAIFLLIHWLHLDVHLKGL